VRHREHRDRVRHREHRDRVRHRGHRDRLRHRGHRDQEHHRGHRCERLGRLRRQRATSASSPGWDAACRDDPAHHRHEQRAGVADAVLQHLCLHLRPAQRSARAPDGGPCPGWARRGCCPDEEHPDGHSGAGRGSPAWGPRRPGPRGLPARPDRRSRGSPGPGPRRRPARRPGRAPRREPPRRPAWQQAWGRASGRVGRRPTWRGQHPRTLPRRRGLRPRWPSAHRRTAS
jgi:hypothetical protein